MMIVKGFEVYKYLLADDNNYEVDFSKHGYTVKQ